METNLNHPLLGGFVLEGYLERRVQYSCGFLPCHASITTSLGTYSIIYIFIHLKVTFKYLEINVCRSEKQVVNQNIWNKSGIDNYLQNIKVNCFYFLN